MSAVPRMKWAGAWGSAPHSRHIWGFKVKGGVRAERGVGCDACYDQDSGGRCPGAEATRSCLHQGSQKGIHLNWTSEKRCLWSSVVECAAVSVGRAQCLTPGIDCIVRCLLHAAPNAAKRASPPSRSKLPRIGTTLHFFPFLETMDLLHTSSIR